MADPAPRATQSAAGRRSSAAPTDFRQRDNPQMPLGIIRNNAPHTNQAHDAPRPQGSLCTRREQNDTHDPLSAELPNHCVDDRYSRDGARLQNSTQPTAKEHRSVTWERLMLLRQHHARMRMRSRPARRWNLSILASWHPLSNSVLLAVMTNLGVGNAMGTAKAGSELRGSTPPTAPQQATAPQASQRERAMLMRTDRSRRLRCE